MSIDKTWIYGLSARIHDLRSRVVVQDILVASHGGDLPLLHGKSFRLGKDAVHGIDYTVVDN
jgi:hypothetical protein